MDSVTMPVGVAGGVRRPMAAGVPLDRSSILSTTRCAQAGCGASARTRMASLMTTPPGTKVRPATSTAA